MPGTTHPPGDAPVEPYAPGPFDRTRPRAFVAVALAVFVNLGSIGAARGQAWATEPGLAGVLLLLVSPAALVFLLPRRPALATILSVAATVAFLLLGHPWGPVFLGPVAVLAGVMLSGEVRRARRIAWSGAALFAGAVGTVAALLAPRIERLSADLPPRSHEKWGPGYGWGDRDGAWFLTIEAMIAGAAWLAVVLLIASAARDRIARRTAARAAARATAAERERTAVASERLRIARELHDVLAHSLSAINVQAGVGLHLLEKNPGQAREALSNIRDTSKDALAEVRTVLGIVREGTAPPTPGTVPADAAPLTPTWDLSGLRHLADQARADGLDVSVELAHGIGDLPDHVAGVVHRVVQESLTNVRRHAPSARRVTLRVTRSDGVEIVVTDDGVQAVRTGDPPEPGYGLLGMRERVEGSGGTLVAGPRPDGSGWEVRATLPVAAPPPTGPARPEPAEPADAPPESGETT
ncbi:sensor histidine kinase [Promicromonospora vindobonensis]|uniref:histidine kinase n=1 Tax=Promicromonospora vindobonensis TaxID=195748 RepID=A0ABW5VRD0_9MICO